MPQNKKQLDELKSSRIKRNLWIKIRNDKYLYFLLLPALISVLFFNYVPIPGIIVAFKDYDIFDGIFGSSWVGLANFYRIFTMPMFTKAIFNTFLISFLNTVLLFPAPIIFALLINEIHHRVFKKVTQTISYMPHFLSMISVVGLAYAIYSLHGPVNDLLMNLGIIDTRQVWMGNKAFFIPNVLIIQLWKGIGWGSIIYLATITSIDPNLYEAAYIDGAGRLKQIIHITLPSIAPTVIMLFILKMGSLFKDNFQLIYGLQNAFVDFEVISTVVYKQGIVQADYSMATAFGLAQGIVAFIMIFMANKVSNKISDVSIW